MKRLRVCVYFSKLVSPRVCIYFSNMMGMNIFLSC